MQNELLKKIVVIGPESTGKSTLCKQLAEHFSTRWVPEYAREYLNKNGPKYSFEDLMMIAKGQLQTENELAEKCIEYPSKFLFIDTNLYVIKVWSEFVFNNCDNRILKQISENKYDLYLLCDTDLPWEADALREYPDIDSRMKLFHYYKDAMVNQEVPWAIINGNYNERFESALKSINKLFKTI